MEMGSRILIVDDNPTNLKLASEILESAGCTIEQALDAEQAVDLLDKWSPDLILMDIALPGMDGLTLTRKLKADARFKDIPIIALTASAMKGDDAKALAAGCKGYITKPIDTRRFAGQILAFLPIEAAAAALTAAPMPDPTIILVVDDKATNRKLLRATLESTGYAVLEAANGVQALEVLDRERVDAIISDILMPMMDGFRLCHEIRKSRRRLASLPFILYTATYDSPTDRELAATVGADAYVLKPAPLQVLIEALQQARQKNSGGRRPSTPRPDDTYVLEQYSSVLVRKLEERNAELQQSLTDLQAANEQIRELNSDLEARVRQRTAALEAANKDLESFTYSISHDLRAPLRHVQGYVEMLTREIGSSQLSAKAQHHLKTIADAGAEMGDLIDDLLEFSRTGQMALRTDHVHLDELVQDAMRALETDLKGRNIDWRIASLPTVLGDYSALKQVILNLLGNAIKYTRTRARPVIEVGCTGAEDGFSILFVRDNGVGFDMQYAHKLFGVFQRLHRADEFEGTGIGLAIVRQVIVRHEGRVWAEGKVNDGVTFYFTLRTAGDKSDSSSANNVPNETHPGA
jgi:CheY-like chemotaxis protein/nitrogen-specific signal transduction histidine kinase